MAYNNARAMISARTTAPSASDMLSLSTNFIAMTAAPVVIFIDFFVQIHVFARMRMTLNLQMPKAQQDYYYSYARQNFVNFSDEEDSERVDFLIQARAHACTFPWETKWQKSSTSSSKHSSADLRSVCTCNFEYCVRHTIEYQC